MIISKDLENQEKSLCVPRARPKIGTGRMIFQTSGSIKTEITTCVQEHFKKQVSWTPGAQSAVPSTKGKLNIYYAKKRSRSRNMTYLLSVCLSTFCKKP